MTVMNSRSWDDRYRVSGLVWGAGPNRFLVEQVNGLRPGSALDVACGEGRNAVWLAERGWHVVGVDFSPVGLEKARRSAQARGVTVEYVEGDLTTWEPPGSYDLVVVMYLHLPSDLRREVLTRVAGSLVTGGTMLVVGHDASNLAEGHGGPQDPAVLYGPEDLTEDLGGILEIERAERVQRVVSTADGEAVAIDVLVRGRRR
ncbi:MAG: class I SAM-dependent methyltransferase [Acidimicrobiales bacterium]